MQNSTSRKAISSVITMNEPKPMDSLDESESKESPWQKSGRLWGGLLEAALMAPDGEAFVASDQDFALFGRLERAKNGHEMAELLYDICYSGNSLDRFVSPLLDLLHKVVMRPRDALEPETLIVQARLDHFLFCLDRDLIQPILALHVAARHGCKDKVLYLLDRWPERQKERDTNVFLEAVRNKHVDIARLLLDRGWKDGVGWSGEIIEAAATGSAEMVQLFFDRGFHCSQDDMNYHLSQALHRGYVELVRVFLDQGADIHTDDWDALAAAVGNGHFEIVQLLLDRGADVDRWIIDCAVKMRQPEILRLLLKQVTVLFHIPDSSPEIDPVITEWAKGLLGATP